MADGPNVGFATLSVIPSLKGVRKELEDQLEDPLKQAAARAGSKAADQLQSAFGSTKLVDDPDRLFAGVDTAAGKAGQSAADRLADSSAEFRAAGERLSDAASESFDLSPAATQAAGALSRQLDGERSNVAAAGEKLGQATASGVEDGLRGVDASLLKASIEGEQSQMQAAGKDLGDSVAGGLDASLQNINDPLQGLIGTINEDGFTGGQQAGGNIGSGILSGLAEAGVEIAGEFAELGVEAGGAGAGLGASAAGGVTSGLAQGLAGAGDLFGDILGDIPLTAGAGVLAAGAALGTLFVSGFSDAIDREALGDVIAARVGAGAAESEQFGRVSAEVFRQAWGDSTAEVGDAVDAVYSTLADSRESEKALEDLTIRAQALADVFGIDVQSSVQAAGTLVFNGLADNATEAFDLITAGVTNVGSAVRDQLIEAADEYADDFAAVGISGERAFNILVAASEGGQIAIDNAGDSVKELSVRVANLGDPNAQSALEQLSLDADAVAQSMAAGGSAADQATQQIAEALLRVKDPAKQYELAVMLMGGPIENLGRKLLPDFLAGMSSSTGAMRDATGASDDLTNSLKNTDAAFTTVKRGVSGAFEDYANLILQPLADYLNQEDPDLKDAANSFGEFLGNGIVDGLYLTITGPLSLFTDVPGKDAIKGWLGLGDDPEADAEDLGLETGAAYGRGLTAAQKAQLGGKATGFAGGDPGLQLDPTSGQLVPDQEFEITADATQAVASVEQVNDLLKLSADLSDLAGDRADNYLARIGDSTSLDDTLISTLDLTEATWDLSQSLKDLSGNFDVSDIAAGTGKVYEDQAGVLRDIVSVGSDAQQVIADALEFGGAEAGIARADQLRAQFQGMFEDAGYTTEQVQELLDLMGLSDWQIDAAVELSGADEAMAKLTLLRDFYTNDDGKSGIPDVINTQVNLAIAEGRFVDAANLISLWVKDTEDGFITDPLLVAMGLGDTAPASGAVEDWKTGEEAKPPADVQVGANTEPATTGVDAWRLLTQGLPLVDVGVGANTDPARVAAGLLNNDIERLNPTVYVDLLPRYDNGLIRLLPDLGAFQPFGGKKRSDGGPVNSGDLYMVGENEPELFMSDRAGRILNQKQIRDEFSGPTGGGTTMVNHITVPPAPDPERQGARIARAMRRKDYLTGSAA